MSVGCGNVSVTRMLRPARTFGSAVGIPWGFRGDPGCGVGIRVFAAKDPWGFCSAVGIPWGFRGDSGCGVRIRVFAVGIPLGFCCAVRIPRGFR